MLSFSTSKITPPHFPHIIYRKRLLELLDRNRDKKLILILGQAAQGKSTLAVSWIDTSKVPSAWINLGPEDTAPVSLFYTIVHSLELALPQSDFTPLLVYPSMTMGPREEIPMYRDWALSLFKMVSTPIWIIFDGLDQITNTAPAYRFLQVLVDEAPGHLHFLMLSRELPPLGLEGLKIRQAAYILPGEDLAFTQGETRKFFKMVHQLALSSLAVKQIHQLTEGWAGGIVLLSEGLARLPETEREEYLFGSFPEQFKGEVFKYFGEQIFASLPQATQEFLVKSTILDVVDPDFIKDFLGIENGREILEDLARRNLFIQPIYDKKRGWLYRYHLLFRDFLSAKFQTLLEEGAQLAAYLRAGDLSEQRGKLELAVQYYLKARAFPRAISVIERTGMPLLKVGKHAEVSQWLQALPAELILKNPWLLFYQYLTRQFTGDPEIIFSLQKAFTLFEAQGDVRGSILCLAYLIEASVSRGHPSLPPIQALLAQGENLVQSLAPGQYMAERAILWFQIGFANYLRSGDLRKAVWACQNAYLLARDLGDIPLQINALIHVNGALSVLGEFSRAEEVITRVEGLLKKCPSPDLPTMHFIHLSQFYCFQGDLQKAANALDQAKELAEKHRLSFLLLPTMIYEQMVRLQLGQYTEAEEIGKNLVNLTFAMGNLFLHGDALLHLGAVFYQKADFLKAKELLQQARELLSSPQAGSDFLLAMVKGQMALVSYHLQENGDAKRDLEEVVDYLKSLSAYLFLKEAHLALGLLNRKLGRGEEAEEHLLAGMNLARERGYYINLLLNRDDTLKACILALDLGLEEVWDYTSRLLATPRFADLSRPELERLSKHPSPKVAAKVWEIRRAIHRARIPRLRIQTLGRTQILQLGASPRNLERRYSQLLLKAILAHGHSGLPLEVLMEDLWPESTPEVAEKNFKVNLHRLRKFLEPHMDRTFGSSYVHLKANLVSLDPELCQVDIDEFLSLIRQGEQMEGQAEFPKALALYHQALDLYKGDFLAEDPYLEWAVSKRERLRDAYLQLLYRTAELHEGRGALTKAIDCYKNALHTDPLAETSYQKLMLLYFQRGMRTTALRLYNDCRKALREGLGEEPDETTTAIFRKIKASI